ncbi:ScbA/BarX family gamma-butyrolactone biosynthesis protein [Streptomyces acidiscabies]|uniref:ScbA/BarX family gamma-butyrolactone biosynthesis protein n=1 Tax=Streptomyces acidiscabies TaxID=42234 RepID=UPI00067D30D0|nr:ScbA/BarX family gamma-butyrolactone biosynthesis protein [Streptomyces acidiscabies]
MSETLVIQPDLSAAPQTPAWDRTVPRHLVHRRSVAEVLLTDALRVSDTRFLVAAQWPLRHSTFRPDPEGRHDPVFVVETIRQMGLLIPRVFLGSPPDTRLLIRTVGFTLDPAAEPRTAYGASDVLCEAELSDVRQVPSRPGPLSLAMKVAFSCAGVPFGHAEGRLRTLTPHQYTALRTGRAQRPPLDVAGERPGPAEVGVAGEGGVMVRRAPDGTVRVDPADLGHPLFFDHPSDHVPGMVLLESARQAACLALGRGARLLGADLRATGFTEWTPAASFECTPGEGSWGFKVVQEGVATAAGTLTFGH